MTTPELINGLALSVIGSAYILLFTLLLIVWNRIENVRKDIGGRLDKTMGDVNKLAQKFNEKIDRHTERINILDRIASRLTDEEFDSKHVAAGQQPIPGGRKDV